MPLWMGETEQRVIEMAAELKAVGRDIFSTKALAEIKKSVKSLVGRIEKGLPLSTSASVQNHKVRYLLKKGARETGRLECIRVVLKDGREALVDDRGRAFYLPQPQET